MSVIYVYKPANSNDYTCEKNKLFSKKRLTEPCEMCNENNSTEWCNKCGVGICDKNECVLKFPHRGNTIFSICSSCTKEIDAKLIPLIDLGKLSLLKERIRTNSTARSPRSLSVSSISTSSSSTLMNRTISDTSDDNIIYNEMNSAI